MQKSETKTRYRHEYKQFPYAIDGLDLTFKLFDEKALVSAKTDYKRNPDGYQEGEPLILYGEELQLVSIRVDGSSLDKNQYFIDDSSLTILNPPEQFQLEIVTEIFPDENTSLEGLYRSNSIFCTQCEAEGFRKITYYPDRPDVLTRITTRIEADQTSCPVMLSNGNLIEQGSIEGGRHIAVWEDPFPKPSYLFALVAGDLARHEDKFITMSGKTVDLHIYVEKRNHHKCDHAMRSLKKAMRWDEERFGREYDLDIFMIVAVDDFNMGAMENKGLNIFNSKYVLSTPESATDQDYLGIEGVIAHEYFHNWTGNRITCRDWFQLSLKEGLTVFRDQEFSADMNSRPVQRIDDVRVLKTFQFKEDSGPMAHPVRPDSYQEINNFYTATVYNKGAEVIRMIHTLLGEEGFRAGMDLYFDRHDGQAVTCDDFVKAMEDATAVDLGQFRLWYSQSGTPVLDIEEFWDENRKEYILRVKQDCPDTPGQTAKKPFHMPLAVGLLDTTGSELLKPEATKVLQLTERDQKFVFTGILDKPSLSFLRDFSAPVRVASFQSREELAHIAGFDSNLYNRWDAASRLSQEVILEVAEMMGKGQNPQVDNLYLTSIHASLTGKIDDEALLALALQLPSEATLAQEVKTVDPSALHLAREFVKQCVAKANKDILIKLYNERKEEGEYSIRPEAMARRSLKNTLLSFLLAISPQSKELLELCRNQYFSATNMTDAIGALSCLVHIDLPVRDEVLDHFYERWSNDPLVLDKWFTLQAISQDKGTLGRVRTLMEHPAFSITNPNKVRALIGGFCGANHYRFHEADGSGYRFLTDIILQLDPLNPLVAARMVSPFTSWRRYEEGRRGLMRQELERILAAEALSRDVEEIVSKCLAVQ